MKRGGDRNGRDKAAARQGIYIGGLIGWFACMVGGVAAVGALHGTGCFRSQAPEKFCPRTALKQARALQDRAGENMTPETQREVLRLLKTAAYAGLPEAQYTLGLCLLQVHPGADPAKAQAVDFLQRAASAGHADAWFELGRCRLDGIGTAVDERAALRALRRADELGCPRAAELLPRAERKAACLTLPPQAMFDRGRTLQARGEAEEGVQWLTEAADRGHARACYVLGCCFNTGEGVPQDTAQAVHRWQRAAEAGDADALYELGLCYYLGRGTARDYARAEQCWAAAAQKGQQAAADSLPSARAKLALAPLSAEELLEQARAAVSADDYDTALPLLEEAADRGNPVGLTALGRCRELGLGGAESPAEAVHLYRAAAEQQYPQALYRLGDCYYNGYGGLPKDYAAAARYWVAAAEAGDPLAQWGLCLLLQDGLGTSQDYAEAEHRCRQAAQAGLPEARAHLPRIAGLAKYAGMPAADVLERGVSLYKNGAWTEALECFLYAAELPRAQYRAGVCYELGRGAAADDTAAVAWYARAAAADFPPAMNKYGIFLEKGRGGLRRDAAAACTYYFAAADRNFAPAQYNLALCYERGLGVPRNSFAASNWYRRAAAGGHSKARYAAARVEPEATAPLPSSRPGYTPPVSPPLYPYDDGLLDDDLGLFPEDGIDY